MARFVGITHRVKRTAEGEARPTIASVSGVQYELASETDELDWLQGKFPIRVRKPTEADNLALFPAHHIGWRKVKESEDRTQFPQHLLMETKEGWYLANSIPEAYDGLTAGDVVGMVLGGSGDKLAFALSRMASELGGATVIMRIPPFFLAKERGEYVKKDKDAQLLELLVREKPELFYPVTDRDRNLILVREYLALRTDTMKDRMGCGQRLRQRFIGRIFCSPEGKYPEGKIEDQFEAIEANDARFQTLVKEENEIIRQLTKALGNLDIYRKLFEPIKGVGPLIAARIVGAIIDIRRFKSVHALKKFCGVHVNDDGTFPRRKHGQVANWHPDVRQALYLLGDQFNRRPDSVWGQEFRKWKQTFTERHPHPVVASRSLVSLMRQIYRFFAKYGIYTPPEGFVDETKEKKETPMQSISALHAYYELCRGELMEEIDEGKIEEADEAKKGLYALEQEFNKLSESASNGTVKIYSPGHIHKMAFWRTLTKFVEWLFTEWWKLEGEQPSPTDSQDDEVQVPPPAPDTPKEEARV